MKWGPKGDGVDHINIYSKAKTELGRWLTNFAYAPFTLSDHGRFTSVEGYWYWLSTGCQHEELRDLFGAEAKRRGKSFERVEFDGNFEEAICKAIRSKLLSNKAMLSSLIDSNLPLTHYYVYGYSDDNCKVINAGYEWITEYIDSVRKSCQQREWKP
jgi:hypothetical protein